MDDKVPCAMCGKPVSTEQAAKRNGLCPLCSVKAEEKIPCAECGKEVSAKLASKRNGLCLRCSAKRNPFFVLYSSLIDRVCNLPGGFGALSNPEKFYYTLTLFHNEVNNGGFHQFFFNSSGSYYEMIEKGLMALNESQARELLKQAKEIVFPEMPVPIEEAKRRDLMRNCVPSQLDELDRSFYANPDTLTPKLKAFAREQGLVPAESESNPS